MKKALPRCVRQFAFAKAGRGRAGWKVWPRMTFPTTAGAAVLLALLPGTAAAQKLPAPPAGPQKAVIGALRAACSQNIQQFPRYLLAGSRQAFANLSKEKQKIFLKRFSLTSVTGHARALLDTQGRMVVQCITPAETVNFHLEKPQLDHNVAFIPVRIGGAGNASGERTDFGLVRQPGGWRLFSLGLLVVNVPALVRQWEEADMQANQQAAASDLLSIAEAIKQYHSAFGEWPNSIHQLGPAPINQVSPQHAQLLPANLASGTTDGYRFRYRVVTGQNGTIEGFELGAVPVEYDKTGRKSFFLDKNGKLHAADKQGAPATGQDPVIPPPAQGQQ